MQRARHQPFAGSRLACDKNGWGLLQGCDLSDSRNDLADRVTFADDPHEGKLPDVPLSIVGELLPQPGTLTRAVGQQLQFVQIDRLLDIVERPKLDRLHRPFNGAVGGHDNDGNVAVEFLDFSQQLDAACARQTDVQEDQVWTEAIQQLQRLIGVLGHLCLVPLLGHEQLDRAGQGLLIVHNQQRRSVHAIPSWSSGDVGRVMLTVVPTPGVLAMSRCPPFCAMYRLAMARPRPVPSARVVKNGSQTDGSSCVAIPPPVSAISRTTDPAWPFSGARYPRIVSAPPFGMASRALEKISPSACST